MPVRVDLSSNASVRLICVDEDNTACAYLANLYIPVFSLDSGRVIHTYDVHNQIVGLQLRTEKKNALYAIDDSFGMHIFDLRTNQRNKKRLNPEIENHNVVCTALSTSNILAISSSEFGGGILDVRGSRRREHHPYAVTLFDIRYAGEPVTTYAKKHGSEVTSMEFYKNGHDLLTGDMNGALKVFNTQLRDEDNACRWERWMKGPITKVGVINKRIVYGIGNRSEATVFVDNNKGALETLYGSVQDSANKSINKTSKAFYKKPEWCLGLMKGVNDDLPLVAVHGVQNEKFISLTAMNQMGVRQEKPILSYAGHTGEVKCMTVTSKLLLTGGEDGKVVIQHSDFKHPQFGHDSIPDHRLTLNRGNLAEKHDQGEDEDEPEPEPEPVVKKDSSDSDSDADDSDSDEPSSKKKNSRALAAAVAAVAAPSTSSESNSAAASSSNSEPKRTTSEERLFQHYMNENSVQARRERDRQRLREHKRKNRKREESEGWETVSEDEERLEIERREKEEEKKKQELIAAGLYVPPKKEKKQKKKRPSTSSSSSKMDKKEKREEAESSSKKNKEGPSTSSSSSNKKESKEDRAARKEREAKEARKNAKKEKEAEEERKAKEEREKRKAMKMAETKEERAARKDRERKEREREERKREERKKEDRKKQRSGESSSGASEAKKPKTK